MSQIKIKIKKLIPHAILPEEDKVTKIPLIATDFGRNLDYNYIEYGTGLAFELPPNCIGMISVPDTIHKTNLTLLNTRLYPEDTGELVIKMKYEEEKEYLEYSVGEIVAYLTFVELPEVFLEINDGIRKKNKRN